MLIQSFNEKHHTVLSKSMASCTLVQEEKPAYIEAKFSCCAKCSGPLIEASFCKECRGIIDLICMACGTKSTYDTHDFCYCQLDVLVPSTRSG